MYANFCIAALGPQAITAVPHILLLLRYPSKVIRKQAIQTLSQMGSKAKHLLQNNLKQIKSIIEQKAIKQVLRNIENNERRNR